MPSIFTHAIFAGLLGRASLSAPMPARFWVLTLVCPMIPDADVISFAFGVSHDSIWSHRGVTHSIIFASVLGSLTGVLAFRKEKPFSTLILIIYFFLVTLSHPLLDMLTNGGQGVALFAPFSSDRLFFPWRPVEVSPIGLGFFSSRGLDVFLNEIEWVWLPAIAVLAASLIFRRLKRNP